MTAASVPIAKFRCGRILTTPNALSRLTREEISLGIRRHQAGDWGDVDETDRRANERALIEGTRLFSIYQSAHGIAFWITTEANRSITTVLLPKDY